MSWETLVTGSFAFKADIEESRQKEVISELEEVLECEIKWNDKYKIWDFQDINWSSHVQAETITPVVEKHLALFNEFELSLYYLSEADEWIRIDEDGEVQASYI